MSTNIPYGDPMAVKRYSVAAFATTQRLPSFRKNITGPAPKQAAAEAKLRGQTSPDYPVVSILDLAKMAGDEVTVDLFDIISGYPVMGDEKLAGKGMSLVWDTMALRINQARGMAETGGVMTQKRTSHRLRGIAMANMSGWANRLQDQLTLIHIAGARGYDNGRDWAVPLESHPSFSNVVVNDILPPTRNRRYFAGDATSVLNLDSSDSLQLGDVDRLRADLDEAVHPLQPIRLQDAKGGMDLQADENPLFVMYLTSRQWHWLKTNTTDPAWRNFVSNAYERAKGWNHPLFMGTTGMWNGILMKKMSRAVRFPAGSTVKEYDASDVAQDVAANVDTDRAVLLGAQALADAKGRANDSGVPFRWHEELTDHHNNVEISISMIDGKKKVRFQVPNGDGGADLTDHGVITMDSYAPKAA